MTDIEKVLNSDKLTDEQKSNYVTRVNDEINKLIDIIDPPRLKTMVWSYENITIKLHKAINSLVDNPDNEGLKEIVALFKEEKLCLETRMINYVFCLEKDLKND